MTERQKKELRLSIKLFNFDGYKLIANSLVKKGLVEKRGEYLFILTNEGLIEREKLLNA